MTWSQWRPARITALFDRCDITDHREPADRAEPNDPAEAMEKADRNDPTDPIEKAEPIQPIDMSDPFDAIERTESSDQSDHRDVDRVGLLIVTPYDFNKQGDPCNATRRSSP